MVNDEPHSGFAQPPERHGFVIGATDEMTDEELDATALEADPDDLGGTGGESGLTAGGTGTSVGQESGWSGGGTPRGHGGTGTTGGERSGSLGGGTGPGEDEERDK